MNKTRVLFLLEAFDKGGIEKVTLDIVNNLDPEKYDITVQTFWYGGHCQSQVHDHIKVIPFFFRRYVRGIIRLIEYLPPRILYKLFIRGTYDIEIAASDGGAAKVISGSTSKAKKICWVHMDVVERGSKLKVFRNVKTAIPIYNKFDKIACVSQKGLSRFQEKFGIYPNMVAVHNPLPDVEIRNKSREFSVARRNSVEFVSVGRIAIEKGFDRLVAAALRLKKEGFDFHIRIVGDGEMRQELENYIRNNQLESVVSLAGFQANPYPYVAAADWYICTSLDEGCPLTIGEAFCLQKPVLGTDCVGVREWLGTNRFGIVMENSADGIYFGLKKALQMDDTEKCRWICAAKTRNHQLSFKTEFAKWQRNMLGM